MLVRETQAPTRNDPAGLKGADRRMMPTLRLLAMLAVAFTGAVACVSESPSQPGPSAADAQAPKTAVSSPGRLYADKACASCHAVAAHETRSPDPPAPPFEAIANTPGMTIMALNVWLHSPHRYMPYVLPGPDELESLSEYLFALRAPS